MDRILVPLDGSSQAEAALEQAFEMFPDAQIHVLTVVQVTSFPEDGTESAVGLAEQRSSEVLRTATEIAADRDREIETHAGEGHAAKTIVSFAEDNDIDHIVMGTTGRSGIQRLLLGSVAESVVRRAPCSVTVTHGE
jgi:nucleotide-binding universal stress UspA family protein